MVQMVVQAVQTWTRFKFSGQTTFEGNNIIREEEYHQGREGFYG